MKEPDCRDMAVSLGKIAQAQEDQNARLDRHCTTEEKDRKEVKDGIIEINLRLAKGITCPHEENIDANKDTISSLKAERKYLYGWLVVVTGTIIKKVFF